MFDLSDADLYDIFRYIKKNFVADSYKIIPIDKILLRDKDLNLWPDENVQGDFKTTSRINEDFISEV